MRRHWRPLTFGVILAAIIPTGEASAQGLGRRVVVTQGSTVVETPAVVVPSSPATIVSRPKRLRNRFFAQRPVSTQPRPGARANVTFSPTTSKYYPKPDSYYPPLPSSPTTRP